MADFNFNNVQKITFITGNANKLKEFQAIMSDVTDIEIDNMKLDLDEYQGTPQEIALKKAKLAATHCDNPILVEDTSLCFNSFNGLPGPYIKDFLKELKPEGLYKMVCFIFKSPKEQFKHSLNLFTEFFLLQPLTLKQISAFEDKTAYAQCIFAYCEDKDSEPTLFVGKCDGKIVEPRGSLDFGWDPVFEPEGYELTFAELDKDIKNKISHRARSVAKLKEFLGTKE